MSTSSSVCEAASTKEDLLQSPLPSEKYDDRAAESSSQQTLTCPEELLQKALGVLTETIQPYLPLHRGSERNTFEGHDLVDQKSEAKPFNAVGIIIEASNLIRSWEGQIESNLAGRIESLQSKEKPVTTTARLIQSKQRTRKSTNEALSQPVAYSLTRPKKEAKFQKFAVVGGGMVFIKEAYLRRMELENLVYRRHLEELEAELQLKLAKQLRREVEKSIKESRAALTPNKTKSSTTPKKAAVKDNKTPTKLQDTRVPKRKANGDNTGQSPRTPKIRRMEDIVAAVDTVDLTHLSSTSDSTQGVSTGKVK